MQYKATTATQKLLKLNKRIRAIQGGTAASKTISILLILIDKCQAYANANKPLLVSVVSESLPHLKRGAMRDFLNIMQSHNYYIDAKWNRTDFIYSFAPNVRIEFFSVDMPDKVRGPRRDDLFINEANNIPLETFNQLEVRTSGTIWLDWNPTNEFWWYTDVMPTRDKNDFDHITLTYLDNEALDSNVVKAIESRRANRAWWRVYGEGQLGDFEGKIYKDWAIIDEIPHEARLERYGLDFGYTNDPTAIVAIYYYNGGYILDEIIYQKGMSNKQIADVFSNAPKALVMADSAEPKSVDEIKSYGIMCMPCTKGRDSVTQGIQYVQQQRISVTSHSSNLIKEYRNYMWQIDRDGKNINKPIDDFNHCMDAIRYGLEGLIEEAEIELPTYHAFTSKTGY